MAVILHGDPGGPAANQPSPPPAGTRMRGPFEPPGLTDSRSAGESSTGQTPHAAREANGQPGGASAAKAAAPQGSASVWEPVSSTMDQIKDLYVTAEAIGEGALDKHFQMVSDRQRQLIKDYFHQAVANGSGGEDRV
jgi:hypothetical protein